uniref:Ferredoxin n=1 Tax=Alaria marginata TaxID=98221 RepID=A0A8F0FBL1_ALAMR|nr:PetF [Alaria marginata]QWK44169.1 ferredoxin [Alaria marginata]UAX20879.1 PetF [Alaria marginata]UAX21866.1 PetF [Alaria marginata]WKY99224.1 PetF [Alaria marginata]WKY99365.1 PetF [Alaria marginata]
MFKIHITNPSLDIDSVIDCPDDQTILEAAEEQDLNLPYSCRAGACSSCTGKLIKGKVDQTEQAFLEEPQIEEGFILTCVAYPQTDCELHSHAEEDIF